MKMLENAPPTVYQEIAKKILQHLEQDGPWVRATATSEHASTNLRGSKEIRMAQRSRLFISYCHKDTEWLRRLQVHLRPLERDGLVDRWDDTRIRPGQKWREQIRGAIDTAKVAVLLVSADFLASDFIAKDELPPLLLAAEEEGAVILQVLLKPCRFKETGSLCEFQAMNSPEKTIVDMTEGERERLWLKLTNDIMRHLQDTRAADGA